MMKISELGSQGLRASQLGLGCMGMSDFYGAHDDDESIRVLHRAIELGISLFDTSDAYGPHTNESLVGRAIQGRRDKVVLATKFGIVRDPNDPDPARPERQARTTFAPPAKGASDDSGWRSSTSTTCTARIPATPIEETVGAMAGLVQAGKVRGIGLSEVSPETLRKAHAVHPISALQTEYSLWSRDPEDELLAVCRELGIAFVAYSPLGRGFLTGRIRSLEDFDADDWRRTSPDSRARTCNAISRWSRRSRAWRWRKAARRRSSPWPGSWRRATSSFPSRGRGT